MSLTDLIAVFGAAVGSPILLGVLLGLYLITHPEKVDQWWNLLYRFLSLLATFSVSLQKRIEHGLVASEIQAAVNTEGEALSKQAPGVLPYALKVEWVKEQDQESFIRDGEVVVRLRHHTNPEKNLVGATLAYVKRGLLPRSRRYVGHLLMRATDFAVAKRIFATTKEVGASTYFFDNVFVPALEAEPRLRDESKLVDDLDGVGVFSRVFLTQVRYFGERVFPADPTPRMADEIKALANYLRTIATKARDEQVPLSFTSPRIKLAIVLVARRRTVAIAGVGAYTRRMRLLIRDGFESIYICGWGEEYVGLVRDIVKRIKRDGRLRIVSKDEFPVPRYTGDINRGILVTCHTSASFLARHRELTDDVRNAFLAQVPELVSAELEIVDIARQRGVGSKVAVRATGEGKDGRTAADICRGLRLERLHAIRESLSDDEWLGIVDWDADLELYIYNALVTLDRSDVTSIELDETNLEALVRVRDQESAALAVGRNGENVRLAGELVGWKINVLLEEGAATAEADPTAPVIQALEKHVPEISSGAMEIVDVARQVGFGTKVAVRVVDRQVVRGPAVQVCVGPGRKRYDAIKNQLPEGEHLRIVDCGTDQEAFITQALYPLREWEVLRVHVDQDERRATVVVRDAEAAAKAIGTDGQNVRLAQRLTGWQIDVLREDQHSA